ncbi:FAD-dependent oxidoreductase [Bradyrhizobium sp. 2TAF24]|uniref:FAD-dependent oxidoreductase n=1 Tax=Bradyrhizobium sp. 2TAF24 TaxID=3233011 RepID=UPI003F8EC4D9
MVGSQWDHEIDVLVMGSGAGGMAAALTVAQAGLTVMVVEKTEYFGGSTAVSGGAVWIPENPLMASVGHSDSRASVWRYLEQTLGNRLRRDMVEAYLDAGPRMVSFMAANTAVKLLPRAYSPDYEPELEGASLGGRTLDPAPFDGRELGRHFASVRAPLHTFVALGGMMVDRKDIANLLSAHKSAKSFVAAAKLIGRYLSDRLRYPRGTRLILGNALAARLLKSALDRGIDLRLRTGISELIIENGRVVGAVIETSGRSQRVRARKAVVLAGGGAPQNPQWRAEHVAFAGQHTSMSPPGNVGDGIRLGISAGGVMESEAAEPAFLTPVSILKKADGSTTVFPHLVLDRQKPGVIAVNRSGRRFVNEATSYHSFVEGMYQAHQSVPSIPSYLVCDAAFVRTYGLGLARPGPYLHGPLIRAGYLIEAQTLPDLARAIGVDAAALAETVANHNRYAQTGVDPEFGKGSSEYNRYLGDPDHKPNPCLGPIVKPPFYAVRVWPGDIGSALGLKTDTHARVLSEDGEPIAGLYACGNDMRSIMAGNYPAAGITLGPALTFGYIAGCDIAGRMP